MVLGRFGMAQQPKKEKFMLRLGMQTYSLRMYGFRDALKRIKELGLTYCEAYPGMLEQSFEAGIVTKYLTDLKEFGITMPAFGVIGFGEVAEHNRLWFDFGKKMGIKVLTADPTPESFDSLEKLVEEFDIKVAIHNHGPRTRYSTIEDVEKALKGRNPKIGACVDTGHFLRSQEDPVKAIQAFGSRVYAVHLKDFISENDEAITGTGDLDIEAVFKALEAVKYQGIISLEYERETELMESLRKCVTHMKAAAAKLA